MEVEKQIFWGRWMTSFTNHFSAQVEELQKKLKTFQKKMDSLPHTSRFVCQPGLERRDGYVAVSPRFYVFREGQKLPEYLVLVKRGKVKLRCGHTVTSEALETAKIDIINHGFNAFVDVRVERLIDRKTDYVTGVPALLVSRNYRGDVNLLSERCGDNFQDAIYCTVCTPQKDQEFEKALNVQKNPKLHVRDRCPDENSAYRFGQQMVKWGAFHSLGLPYVVK